MKILCCQSCKRERVLREEVEQAKFKPITYTRENKTCKRCEWEMRNKDAEDFETSVQEAFL
jgi:hypothetical protein